jgi:hypothetical protein
MLVANGARLATLNDRFGGIWSAGRGPDAARVDRFNAVITIVYDSVLVFHVGTEKSNTLFKMTTSCVASTYRLCPSGKVIGLSSNVAFVDELCVSIGVCVSRATSSWT